ncbi:MAG: M43 family zinc metalloprotease, partial [Bacteroidia bacterium]
MKTIIFKLLFILVCILSINDVALAQITWGDCAGANSPTSGTKSISCTPVSSTYISKYGRVSGYVPIPSVTPTKIIRISFHFFQKNDGSNNWQNDASHLSRLNTIVNSWMNPRMASLTAPSDPISGVSHIPNSTIQYEISGVYFYQNDYLNTLVTCSANAYDAYVNGVDPSRISTSIPIYVTGGAYCGSPAAGFSIFPSESALNQNSYVVTFNAEDDSSVDYAWATHLLHELGHALDLTHTYDANQYMLDLDYLSDVYNTTWWNYCSPAPNYACKHQAGWIYNPYNSGNYATNNLMGGTQFNEYLSPLQLGKINRALSIKSVRKYVKPMSSSTNDWVVNQNETWDFDIQMYQNIRVTNGATLTIKCKVAMATNGLIVVDQGANLVITDGALITSWTGSMWTGIVLNGGSSLLVDNASTIEKAKVAIESKLGAPFTLQNGAKLNANHVG